VKHRFAIATTTGERATALLFDSQLRSLVPFLASCPPSVRARRAHSA
jgi:hypothetical protein